MHDFSYSSPKTGFWTGTLIAEIMELWIKDAILAIIVGVMKFGIVMATISLEMWGYEEIDLTLTLMS